MDALRQVVIHGHFYQPPREDPWLDEVPRQPGAAPWHDWNEKIERECYRPVAAARVLDADGQIASVSNLYASLSFDVGPTLFEWLERMAPATCKAIIDADRTSVVRWGHGNAIAQPYHHVILPLATRRDKTTEVRWGIADFRRRFDREPEGMWLPETAVDDETLDVLAQEGIRFTILDPKQVTGAPANGLPAVYRTKNGREIAICLFDRHLSHGVAFGRLLTNARVWKAEMLTDLELQRGRSVVAIATDGETYGHHHPFSEMALAWLLEQLEATDGVQVTNFASLVASFPPTEYVRLVEPSAWSCDHGVGRWRGDCGCRMDATLAPSQAWRAPLRAGLNSLRDALHEHFESEGATLFHDPWVARDEYGAAAVAPGGEHNALAESLVMPGLTRAQIVRARELLELQRDALRMFTSCAWFFDDIAGIEAEQTLRYAARALDLLGAAGPPLERALLAVLREAMSNDLTKGNGEDVWARGVRPVFPPTVRLAAGAAAAQAFVPGWGAPATAAWEIEAGEKRVALTHRRTGRRLTFDAQVARRGVADVQAYVRLRPDLDSPASAGIVPLTGTIPVRLDEYPERERILVRDSVRVPERRALADRLLGAEVLAQVAHGDWSLTDAASFALITEVNLLAREPAPGRIERAIGLTDLLELLGRSVPFDAQSAFANAVAQLEGSARNALDPLATRLGFSHTFMKRGVAATAASSGESG